MVYKRYIKRKGKKYGPYYYKSIRVKGKVKNIYVGKAPKKVTGQKKKKPKKSRKKFWLFALPIIFIILFFSLSGITGFFISGDYFQKEIELEVNVLGDYYYNLIESGHLSEISLFINTTENVTNFTVYVDSDQSVNGNEIFIGNLGKIEADLSAFNIREAYLLISSEQNATVKISGNVSYIKEIEKNVEITPSEAIQGKIEIGQPVGWVQNFSVYNPFDYPVNITLPLPQEAFEIEVIK